MMSTDDSDSKNAMPIFYRAPRPLDRQRDAGLRLSRPTHFGFAAGTNAIPLIVDEFPMAAAYYPIVFAAGQVPAAVVGLRNDQNAFIDTNGRWRSGYYIPAYVRRYPFILMDDPERKQFVLCIDEQSDLLGVEGDYPLFEDDRPSEFTQSAMQFCAALQQQGDATESFVEALQKHNLLMQNDAQIDMPDETRLQLSGFQVIDPTRFDALPADDFAEWRSKGWLGLVYAQLLSSHRWQNVTEQMGMAGEVSVQDARWFPPTTALEKRMRDRPRTNEEFRLLRRPNRREGGDVLG